MVEILINSFKTVLPKLALSQLIGWGISVAIDNTTCVDVAWGVNHMLFATIASTGNFKDFSLISKNPRKFVAMVLISLWFTRLCGFLLKERIFKRHVDPRYTELAEKRKLSKYTFGFYQFQLQGLLSLFTGYSINYVFTHPSTNLGPLAYVGVAMCIVGIIGETVADLQIQKFKNTNTDPQAVFRGGLFKKSRHPNLFFEQMFWWGIAVYSVNTRNLIGCLPTFFGPLFLWFVMSGLTIPITEAHMKTKRPEYYKVVAETNKFLPF